MNVLRFDSLGGASGDMILAALIDLGADPQELTRQLTTLGIEDFELDIRESTSFSQKGTQVTVKVADMDHPHRHLSDIRDIINSSSLDPGVKTMSIKVFERLAEAEATVHGATPDEVHFHEVGAMDAIVDITGCCLALSSLNIEAVMVSPIPTGTGSTTCAHGVMPLPVPATAELLKGFHVTQTEEPFELVTPTGAALLTTWCKAFPAPAREDVFVIKDTGNGIGHRKLNTRPNLLRSVLLERSVSDATPSQCAVIEFNVDDTSPELLGSLSQQLINEGAMDVFMSSVFMKKQRPGVLMTVLSRPEDRDRFIGMIFAETTTFGIRTHAVQRTILDRRHRLVETPYGPVRIKIGSRDGIDITQSPEHSDCVKLASQHSVPIRTVYESAMRRTEDVMQDA